MFCRFLRNAYSMHTFIFFLSFKGNNDIYLKIAEYFAITCTCILISIFSIFNLKLFKGLASLHSLELPN